MDYKAEIARRIREKQDTGETEGNDLLPEQYERSEYFKVETARAQVPALELRLANGDSDGVSYFAIKRWRHIRSEGIILITADEKITITGRNLKVLFNFLMANRVKYIQCNIGNDIEEDESKLFVKSIAIDEL